jgi:hypothetical protein
MSAPDPRKPELIDAILVAIREGTTLRTACKDVGVSGRTVRHWRHTDKELGDTFFKARLDGTQAKLDVYEDKLNEAEKSGDRNKILGADKLLAHARWEAEKLLALYQPVQKSQVENLGGPMIIGWASGNEQLEGGKTPKRRLHLNRLSGKTPLWG